MKKKEKTLSTVLAWQTISKFLIQGLAFFTAPIFTRLLTPEDYGQLSVFHAWISFLGIFVGLQTHQSIPISRVRYKEKNELNIYLFNAIFISFLSFIIIFPFTFIFREQIGRLLSFPANLVPFIPINAFFSYCVGFYSIKLIQFKNIGLNTFISFISAIATIFFSLLFIYSLDKQRYISKIFAETFVTTILGFIFLLVLCINGKFRFNKTYVSFCLSFSIPLILHGAGGIIFTQSDRVMLQKMVSPSEAGIYSIVYNFALVINLIKQSFSTVWEPFYYDYKSSGVKDIRSKASVYLKVFWILTAGFILLAPEVFKIMISEQYWEGVTIIPIIAVAYFFNFLYTFPSLYEFYNKKTTYIAFVSISCAFFNIGLNFLLIPKFGAFGAAFATLVTHFIEFMLHALIVKVILKAEDYDYDVVFYLSGIIPIFVITFVCYITIDLWVIRWGIGVLLGAYLLYMFIKNKKLLPVRNIQKQEE